MSGITGAGTLYRCLTWDNGIVTSSYDSWLEGQKSASGPARSLASPYGLWIAAGGGTESFDRQRYRDLLFEHGALLRPGDEGYDEAPKNLPCGWPGRPE